MESLAELFDVGGVQLAFAGVAMISRENVNSVQGEWTSFQVAGQPSGAIVTIEHPSE
jgi:hypothetical protein